MTWLSLLNFIILQWFFIRLARIIDRETKKQIGWTILKWICPLTGWYSNYIYIGGHK